MRLTEFEILKPFNPKNEQEDCLTSNHLAFSRNSAGVKDAYSAPGECWPAESRIAYLNMEAS